jgi:hypothetical protein
MQTQTGMLAQAIQQDRVRGYEDPSRLHRIEMTRSTARASSPRKLFARSILRFGRPTGSGPILARSAF